MLSQGVVTTTNRQQSSLGCQHKSGHRQWEAGLNTSARMCPGIGLVRQRIVPEHLLREPRDTARETQTYKVRPQEQGAMKLTLWSGQRGHHNTRNHTKALER